MTQLTVKKHAWGQGVDEDEKKELVIWYEGDCSGKANMIEKSAKSTDFDSSGTEKNNEMRKKFKI